MRESMHSIITLFVFCITYISLTEALQWGPCKDDYGSRLPADCATLKVPLDYTDYDESDPDAETLDLELFRIKSASQPARGSILLNFGGPGQPCQGSLARLAPLLQPLSGGDYNLITFDPRGTGKTIPFECYVTNEEQLAYKNDIKFVARAQDTSLLGRLWARSTITAEKCAQRQNKTGSLLGTAFVARDMVQAAENLEEDGLLRYWGFSYGTTLGATLVSMFPDKVDKVILDGVQNPHEYYHSYADIQEWSDSDEEFSHIFHHCTKNPDVCSFARHGATAAQLEDSVWDLIDALDSNPIVLDDQIIDRSSLGFLISNALYSTELWNNLTTTFDMLIHGPKDVPFLRGVFGLDTADDTPDKEMAAVQAILGIHCSDRAARAGTLEKLMPTLKEMANVSRVLDGIPGYINLPCAQWPFEPKERYEGDFAVTPRNPVLVIGNTWDGLTPARSARNVSAGFEGSAVLEVHGYGHTSLKIPSLCSAGVMRDYWQHGTLPKPGSVCAVDAPPFSNITWEDILKDDFGVVTGEKGTQRPLEL